MEVNGLTRAAVGARLGVRQAGEDSPRLHLDVRSEATRIENGEDVAEGSVHPMARGIDHDVDLGSAEGAPLHLTNAEIPAPEPELVELTSQAIHGSARVDERGHDHVARRATRTVEVRQTHSSELSDLDC